tara:strand:- start:786 stop:1436 length:651 start_codon:yes stop_codon:yes gene_type:complete
LIEVDKVKEILVNELGFSNESLDKLNIFHNELLKYNEKYNLISKSTEKTIWWRHILDSAQINRYIDFKDSDSLSDLGSGAGFPGLILAIYNNNPKFHVKLYEKSPIKSQFLRSLIISLGINCELQGKIDNNSSIESEYIVCRAFKKIDEIMRISREIATKNHKIIILKGKSAQEEINKAFKGQNIKYNLADSITDKDSKIILIDFIKNERNHSISN